jgi:hypothetical protein
MHEHGPDCMEGPIRGTHAWWRGLAPVQEPAAGQAQCTNQDSHGAEEPGIRKELVERIRREIAAGTYDTPEKWQAALDKLAARLHEE